MNSGPIVSSLLDTDFYKLLMLQLIRRFHPDLEVEFAVINRSKTVRLADEIDVAELRVQLDHVRTLRFTEGEIAWLRSNSLGDGGPIFSEAFLESLNEIRLPGYELAIEDGELHLNFRGRWSDVTLWEIPALAIVNELRTRAALRRLSGDERDDLHACAEERLQSKLARLKALRGLRLSDFGTRRRYSLAWQDRCVRALMDALGPGCIGTSNATLAMKHGIEAVGTNGHELPMVLAAIADTDEDLRRSPYRVLEEWQSLYRGKLLIALPDTYGSRAFLREAPEWVAGWTGFRPDSAPPIEAGEQIIDWWRSRREDPKQKLLIFSDALDVDLIERLHAHFSGRVRVSFGWGTNLTNDFAGCIPRDTGLRPISLVCKVSRAGGRPAVKLSDNPGKATGDPAEVARYLHLFGGEGMERRDVVY